MLRRLLYSFLLINSVASSEEKLMDLSLEKLMSIELTSFDGTAKEWKKTPAAVYVVTQDAIRNSAARSIPELLRGVPGIHVSQIDSHTWGISSRGFTRRYSNKLQVLVDGRSIYTPLFSGVHWELNDLPLEDIDRIEVTRGPGGSLWGANAVNGVINIITKSSLDTVGNFLKLGAGDVEKGYGVYRYGALDDENHLSYRLTLNGNSTGHFKTQSGDNKKDDWNHYRLSGRADWEPDEYNSIVFTAGAFRYSAEKEINVIMPGNTVVPVYEDDLESHGFHALTSWEKVLDKQSSLFTKVYFDYYEKEDVQRREENQSLDFETRLTHVLNDTHTLTFGGGYRHYKDQYENVDFLEYLPDSRNTDLFTFYGQDEIILIPDELTLILGTKYELNDHTGSEWQPSVKLLLTPNEEHTFWWSVARAVRTPNRSDEDINNRLFYAGPFEVDLVGSRDVESERVLAYEAGYRLTPKESSLTFDLSLFYNDYNRLNDFESDGLNLVTNNDADGYTYGLETFLSYALLSDWKVSASYSYLEAKIEGGNVFNGGLPSHLASFQSDYSLTKNLSFHTNLHYTDYYSSSRYEYNDSYRLDAGLRWAVSDSMSLSIWGLNLLDPQTLEYADDETGPAEVPRSFYVELEWVF